MSDSWKVPEGLSQFCQTCPYARLRLSKRRLFYIWFPCLHRHLLHVFAVLTAKSYFYLVLSDTGYTLLIILIQCF